MRPPLRSLALVAALSTNRVIGKDGALPWHVPEDLRRVKTLTMGHTLIVGRRTFESIGKPLPGRRIVMVSRHSQAPEGIEVASSLDAALEMAAADPMPFLFGGQAIYEQGMPRVSHMYLTCVDRYVDGDTYFPEFDAADWSTARDELVVGYTDVRFVDLVRVGFTP